MAKNLSHLVKKIVTDKNGVRRTVWVMIGGTEKRHNMPQISAGDMDSFLSMIKKNGITVDRGNKAVKTLKPVQKELNHDAINRMGEAPPEIKNKPVIVSKDNYILDGHHRWAHKKSLGENTKVLCVTIGVNYDKLVEIAKKFDKVYYKDVKGKMV